MVSTSSQSKQTIFISLYYFFNLHITTPLRRSTDADFIELRAHTTTLGAGVVKRRIETDEGIRRNGHTNSGIVLDEFRRLSSDVCLIFASETHLTRRSCSDLRSPLWKDDPELVCTVTHWNQPTILSLSEVR